MHMVSVTKSVVKKCSVETLHASEFIVEHMPIFNLMTAPPLNNTSIAS